MRWAHSNTSGIFLSHPNYFPCHVPLVTDIGMPRSQCSVFITNSIILKFSSRMDCLSFTFHSRVSNLTSNHLCHINCWCCSVSWLITLKHRGFMRWACYLSRNVTWHLPGLRLGLLLFWPCAEAILYDYKNCLIS